MNFITSAARKGFDHLFTQAVRANIALNAGDEVSLMPLSEPSSKAHQLRNMVLFTSASLRFKLVAVFQIVDTAQAKAYFSGAEGGAEFTEVLCERGNLCCGSMNRELLSHTPHLGLSTPAMLHGSPSKVVAALNPEHVSHHAIYVNGQHLLEASLCMRGQAQVDFVVDIRAVAAVTGELELM